MEKRRGLLIACSAAALLVLFVANDLLLQNWIVPGSNRLLRNSHAIPISAIVSLALFVIAAVLGVAACRFRLAWGMRGLVLVVPTLMLLIGFRSYMPGGRNGRDRMLDEFSVSVSSNTNLHQVVAWARELQGTRVV